MRGSALTGFATSTSPNNGHNITTEPAGNGVTDKGAGATVSGRRSSMTTCAALVQPAGTRNTVVQKSTDGLF